MIFNALADESDRLLRGTEFGAADVADRSIAEIQSRHPNFRCLR